MNKHQIILNHLHEERINNKISAVECINTLYNYYKHSVWENYNISATDIDDFTAKINILQYMFISKDVIPNDYDKLLDIGNWLGEFCIRFGLADKNIIRELRDKKISINHLEFTATALMGFDFSLDILSKKYGSFDFDISRAKRQGKSIEFLLSIDDKRREILAENLSIINNAINCSIRLNDLEKVLYYTELKKGRLLKNRFGKDNINIAEVRNTLKEHELILFWSDTANSSMVLLIEKEKIDVVYKIKQPSKQFFPFLKEKQYINNLLSDSPDYSDLNTFLDENYQMNEVVLKIPQKITKLILIPLGFQTYFPFHAYKVNDRPLIDKYSIVYSPSLSFLPKFGKSPKNINNKKILIIKGEDSNILFSKIETKFKITDFFKSKEEVKHFSKENINNYSNEIDCLLFSGHGEIVSRNKNGEIEIKASMKKDFDDIRSVGQILEPQILKPSLLFQGQKALYPHDIMELKLDNKTLVFLNACESFVRTVDDKVFTDEKENMLNYFIAAGAGKGIGTLRKIDDFTAFVFLNKLFVTIGNEEYFHIGFRKTINWLRESNHNKVYEFLHSLINDRTDIIKKRKEGHLNKISEKLLKLQISNGEKVFSNPKYWSAFIYIGL